MATAFVVQAVVEFDGLVPIVHTWCGGKLVVARGLGGIFLVGAFGETLVAEVGGAQGLGGDVVEIIVGCEATACIIVLTKVAHVGRLGIAVVSACHMVGHKVHNQSQASLVCAVEQVLKFGHAFIDVDGQVGVNVVVVLDGIGRTSAALNNGRVVGGNAVLRIVGLRGVLEQARVPNVGIAKLADAAEDGSGEVVHFAAAVLLDAAAGYVGRLLVAIQARQDLVNHYTPRKFGGRDNRLFGRLLLSRGLLAGGFLRCAGGLRLDRLLCRRFLGSCRSAFSHSMVNLDKVE